MSSSPSEVHLGALRCHFTWDLSSGRNALLRLRDKLLDICPDEGNPWRGRIYNLLGFLQTRLGRSDEALDLFISASEALRGPALLVNYSDLAWLHHERGEQELSREYLRKVEELRRERDHTTGSTDHSTDHTDAADHATDHADPAEESLHPEVLAEKAWTLMKFSPLQKRVAVDLFERALKEQPERVEWRSAQAIALLSLHKHHRNHRYKKHLDDVDPEVLLKVRRAHEEDPENLYLSAEYLSQRGEQVEEEAAKLASRIVESACGSYSGLKAILRYYRLTDALKVAIFWAEEALEKYPDSRYVKRCAALCYKWRVLFHKEGLSERRLVDRGVSLLKEVISLYPDTALVKEIDLADLYSRSDRAKAEEVYHTLLQRHLEPPETQLLYNRYAKHLQHDLRDIPRCIEYHNKAILIHHDSFFKDNSIKAIERLKHREWDSVQAEVQRSSLSARLEKLQCHFTWEQERSRAILFTIRDRLEDLLPDHSHPWRGHIYNLLGFLQTRLGRSDEALDLFSSASEALKGPALLVNYSDQAWLYHERGESALSEEYLRRVEELKREYPTEGDQLLPEVYAEKAWTQVELYRDHRLGARLFQRALQTEDRVEWNSCLTLALFYAQNKSKTGKHEDIVEQMRQASERDPDDLQLRAEYLGQCMRRGEEVAPQAAALAAQLLQSPDRLHRDIRALLELYRSVVSVKAAVELAVKALDKRPDSRCLKACLAMCYKWRIQQRKPASQELIERTAALLREVISLYPDSCFRTEIDLANTYAKSNHSLADATRLYQDLLRRDVEPSSKQILCNNYARFLNFDLHDSYRSTEYHLRAAEIPVTSYWRTNSVKALQKIRDRCVCDDRLRAQVDRLLTETADV